MGGQTDYDKTVKFTAIDGDPRGFVDEENNVYETYHNLFDGKKTNEDFSKWCCSFNSSNGAYVVFEASQAGIPVGYTITTGNDNANSGCGGRNPKSWKLYGNNEGQNGTWELIQEVNNDTKLEDVNYASYDFTCEGTKSYKYFKWEISAIHDGSILQVGEFELKLQTCSHKNADGSSALSKAIKTFETTCTERGYTTHKCSICNYIIKVYKNDELKPHTLTHYDAKAVTCTEDGQIEYWQCSICNKLFSNADATTEITDAASLVIPAKGHQYDKEGTCTVCKATDPRYTLFNNLDGITNVSITDNGNYPWQMLNLNAEGMENLSPKIPEGSTGLMSSNYNEHNSSSETVVYFTVEMPILLTFKCLVSSEYYDKATITLDNKEYEKISQVNQIEIKELLSAGSHTLTLSYSKDEYGNAHADRAFIYDLKTTIPYVAEYDATNATLTFKKITSDNSEGNDFSHIAIVKDELKVFNLCTDYQNIKNIIFEKSFETFAPTMLDEFFSDCITLETISGLEYLNTANVTDMAYMFNSCYKLTSLDLTSFNTENVKSMTSMFNGCEALKTIYASDKFVTTNVKYGSNMFDGCKNLTGYDGSKTDYTYANCTTGYFTPGCGYAEFDDTAGTLTFRYKAIKPEGAYGLNEGRNYPQWHTLGTNVKKVVFDASFANARPTSCYGWFHEYSNLTTIEGFEYLNTENVTDMTGVFNGCSALKSLNLSNFNTAKVKNMKLMFAHCSSLESLDLSMFNTASVEDMPNMFDGATNLKTLNVSNFNTEKAKNMGNMFTGCSKLTSLDLSSFNTIGAQYVDNMFNNCSELTTIYASDNFAFGSGLQNGADMFKECKKLKGSIEFNSEKTNHTYANYKTGYFTKLVVKNGDERYGYSGATTQLTVDNLALADNKDFVAYEPFAAKAATYNREMKTGTTWATLCLPFEVSLENQNFRAFKLLSADDTNNTIELEEVKTSIEAGTPVIIKMNDGQNTLDFSVIDKEIAKDVKTAAATECNYQLKGLYTQKMFSKKTDNNCYIVKGDKLMNPAKLLENTNNKAVGSKPFRAYMVDNSAPTAGAKMFSISFDDNSTTAIDSLNTITDENAIYYDLQGKRLNGPQKGINIVKRGNKTMKVIIK
ncbi:BspA family leucine-rich repeat surface protein [Prevotella merdae]|uniref:BspA family leucine-rich repeat surface protein n=1 Tax=Prevotella merdae TaxID=2079531 RepID=UPI00356883B7